MKFLWSFIAIMLAVDLRSAVAGRPAYTADYLRLLVQIIFYGDFFIQSLPKPALRRLLRIATFGFAMVLCLAFFAHDPGNDLVFFSRMLFVYAIFVTAKSLYMLYGKFTAANSFYPADPEAWICFGVVIFFSGFSFIFSLYPLIFESDIHLTYGPIFELITKLLSAMLFASTGYAVYLTKRSYDYCYA